MSDRDSAPLRVQEGDASAAGQEPDAATDRADRVDGDGGDRTREPVSPGSRAALRNWRISTRLVSLLALPVIAATTLGGLRIHTSLENANQLNNMKLLTDMTRRATVLAGALQEERDRSAGPMVSSGNEKDDAVVAPRHRTDQDFMAFKEATKRINDDDKVMAGVHSTVLDITKQLNTLHDIRQRAYKNPEYVSQTVNSYNQLIQSLISLSQDMAQATSNSEMIQSTRALAAFSNAKEYASIQRAIIEAGLAKDKPGLGESDRLFARTASESEQSRLNSFRQIYGDEAARRLTKPLDGGIIEITSADKYRDRVLKDKDAMKREPRDYQDWFDQDKAKLDRMDSIESTLLDHMDEEARRLRADANQETYLNGALIVLVLGISLVGAFVVARSMVRSLRRLQDTAQDVARRRLPELVRQMSEAEPQDVDTSVESVGVHSRDEIGKVAAAFDDVHREAVRLAGEQALLRGNVNAMFTNLSRRSQGLIQRQLSLISELESREADPDQLSSLFKLDHLATRMRRNGENLLVLAGEEPGRRWTRPVPLVDVLRAAASEVEQYERIELNSVPTTEVAGRVVNDLVHLLAELLENATSFSSPQTKVKVTGHALPDGRVLVEIHDTGIGLSPEDLSSINERLANPPTVDVSVSRRMGLFVVGRLSLRHGIRIQLRPSDSGGTTALVMLPVDVAQGGAGDPKGRPGGSGAPGGSRGNNLAAALQRGPGGPGAGLGAGPGAGPTGPGGPRLGAAPERDQVGGGPRPALPGGAAPAGAGAGSGGAESGVDFFGGSRSTGGGRTEGGRPARPGQDQSASGGSGVPGQSGQGAPGSRGLPPLPTRTTSGPAQSGSGGPGDTGRGGPGDTAEFDRPDFSGPPPAGVPGRTAPEAEQPQGPDAGGQSGSQTGQFALPSGDAGPGSGFSGGDTFEFGRPVRPGDASGSPAAGSGGAYTGAPGSGEQPRPSWAGEPAAGEGPRDHQDPQETGEFAQPAAAGQPPQQQQPPQQHAQPQQQSAPDPLDPNYAIPTGPSAGPEATTPIFQSMESSWFRGAPSTGQSEPAQQPPGQPSPPRPGQPASAVPPPQRQSAADGTDTAPPDSAPPDSAQSLSNGTDPGAFWGASPNDERWRQAEQVRQPAAGGVTTSGLPRRVPRANLVAGTAQQQSPAQTGPQVSRAPDDVRGRLTNLRRGIQQGRQAGTTENRGNGPTYQQER